MSLLPVERGFMGLLILRSIHYSVVTMSSGFVPECFRKPGFAPAIGMKTSVAEEPPLMEGASPTHTSNANPHPTSPSNEIHLFKLH
jgi:hypothetical protein